MGPVPEPEGVSDEALLAAMAVGDEKAAVSFVRRHQRRVFGLAMAILSDATLAEEVAQEAFVRVWRHAPVFDARRGGVATWLLTITRNLAIDARRARRQVAMDPGDRCWLVLESPERPTEDAAIAYESGARIRAALEALPLAQRRAVILAGLCGRSALEIAELESVPLGTAKTRIRAGMTKLRSALEKETTA